MIYLASPYSHPKKEIRELRANLAGWAAGILMSRGEKIFSPIAHTVFICQQCGDFLSEMEHRFWMRQDLEVLRFCEELRVLQLPGWEISKGIDEEMVFSKSIEIPITLCHPVTIWPDREIWEKAA